MPADSKIFDDLTKMAGGAMNVLSGLREQISNDIRARVDEMASRMDLVPREDFDRLEAQVRELQKKLDKMGAAPAAKPSKNAAKSKAAKAKSGKRA